MNTAAAAIAPMAPNGVAIAESDPTAITFRHHRTIRAIVPEIWDRLAGPNLAMAHGWISTVEEAASPPVRPLYVVAEWDGIPVAATVCQKRTGGAGLDGHLLGRLRPLARHLGLSFGQNLSCRPLRGDGDPILLSSALDGRERESVTEALVRHLEAYCDREGMSLSFSPVRDGALSRLLRDRDYQSTIYHYVAFLDVAFDSFDGYLRHVGRASRNDRDGIRWERNRNRRAGVIIEEVTDIGPYRNRLFQLVRDHYIRLNRSPFFYTDQFFDAFKHHLVEDGVIYGAFKEGELVGASVHVRRNGIGWSHIIGIDHEACGNDFTYFNLAYYRPLEDAFRHGLNRLDFGNAAYKAKRKRGCSFYRTDIYVRPATASGRFAARCWFKIHRRWHEKKLPGWLTKSPETAAGGSPVG